MKRLTNLRTMWRWFGAVVMLLGAHFASAQIQQAWVERYDNGLPAGTNQTVKMLLDGSGNIYLTGFSQNSNTNLGYVTLKYAPNGNLLWAQRFDSTNYPNATPSAMALDTSNNVVVTGNAITLQYNSNGLLNWTNTNNAAAVAVDPSNNVYITGVAGNFETIKLSPNGSNLWTAMETGNASGPTIGLAIVVDAGGDAFVAGNEPWAPPSTEDYNCLTIVKYGTTGDLIWRSMTYTNVFPMLGFSFFGVSALTLDNRTNLYMELGSGGGSSRSYYTFEFSNSGTPVWVASDPTGNYSSLATAMGVDSKGNVVVTGKDGHGYPSSSHYGTFKINPNGNYVWTNIYPTVTSGFNAANAVAIDSGNNYYVTGYSPGTDGFKDIVTIKYYSSGGQAWLQRYSSPVPGNAAGNSIAVDASGNVYVAGYDTNPGGGTATVLIKYSPVTLQVLANGTVQLQAQGASGELFDVQATSDLQNWQDLGQSAADTNGLFQFSDTKAPLHPARFYQTIPR